MPDTRADLRKNNPETWIAVDAGDSIAGEVIAVKAAWSDFANGGDGGYYPLLTIKAPQATGYPEGLAELTVHGFGTVLYRELVDLEPEPGDRISIVFLGTKVSKVKGRNDAAVYRVRVPGREGLAARNAWGQIKGKSALSQTAASAQPSTDELNPDTAGLPADQADDIPF